jgi:hypothetical protein
MFLFHISIRLFITLVLISACLSAYAQDTQAEFTDWKQRFSQDLKRAADTIRSGKKVTENVFSDSVWKQGLAQIYLNKLLDEDKLFSTDGRTRVWDTGTSMLSILNGANYSGYGGEHSGKSVNAALPDEQLEAIYFTPPFEKNSDLEKNFKDALGIQKLTVPPNAVLQRQKYPILFFKRVGGKLCLAAFTSEFITIIEVIFNAQIG